MTDTLKSICEQCTHLNNPQLDFIPDDLRRLREILTRDIKELVSAASSELTKSVVALAGSVLEAALFGFLKGQESFIIARRGAPFALHPEESLQTLVNVFNRYFGDQYPKGLLPDTVVGHRDLIHVNREVSSAREILEEASRNLLRVLNAVIGWLGEAAGS